jgi:hypothetical protein
MTHTASLQPSADGASLVVASSDVIERFLAIIEGLLYAVAAHSGIFAFPLRRMIDREMREIRAMVAAIMAKARKSVPSEVPAPHAIRDAAPEPLIARGEAVPVRQSHAPRFRTPRIRDAVPAPAEESLEMPEVRLPSATIHVFPRAKLPLRRHGFGAFPGPRFFESMNRAPSTRVHFVAISKQSGGRLASGSPA